MATDFLMPKLAMAMNEGIVSEWLVEEGQYVNAGEPIASVETEKVSYDVESAEAGYFHILLPIGEATPVESVIGIFAVSEEEYQTIKNSLGDASVQVKEPDQKQQVKDVVAETPGKPVGVNAISGRIKSSPLARKMALDNSLRLNEIDGTGPGGRIVKKDILAAVERQSQQPKQSPVYGTLGAVELARISMTGARQTIAQRMRTSIDTAAQVSSSWESDVTNLLGLRQKYVGKAEQLGTKVSVNAFLIKAICYAIKQVPVANSRLEGNVLVVYENVNMGIAVAIPAKNEYDSGLIVPVIKNVERMGLVQLDIEMKGIIQRAKNGELSVDDMSDSTITLSSTAGIAPPGMKTGPILNLGNVAIVGPSTPIERPIVNSGEIVVRTMLPMSFTFDHCLMDGEPAARFMRALHDCLEEPGLMLA
jgi:pyruvate/2-oxoglutarate dehydrogenase complex dihydrolipoamide acyltransferase (E2) component